MGGGAADEATGGAATPPRGRLLLLALGFAAAMVAVGLRWADLASSAPPQQVAAGIGAQTDAAPRRDDGADDAVAPPLRAEIHDRAGRKLAVNLKAYELYFDPSFLTLPEEVAEAARLLAATFPDLDAATLEARFFADKSNRLLKRPLTPRQAQAAHDLGLPGLSLQERSERVYPGGRAVSHVVGFTNVDGRGRGGVEGARDADLSAGQGPLTLSLDLRAQLALHEELSAAVERLDAKAAAGVVMSVKTGEVFGLVSLPDFDPDARGRVPPVAREEDSPLFHRAAIGLYELGSVFKVFTWALALETGVAAPDQVFPEPSPLTVDGFTISDPYPMRRAVTLEEAFAKSSNIIAAELALTAGHPAQLRLFEALGFHEPTAVEALEAQRVRPTWAHPWSRSATATAAYGHGVAATPLHLAAGVASVITGRRVRPTLMRAERRVDRGPAPRVIRESTAARMREMMRLTVREGTGRRAEAPGLDVGGKTGTAVKLGADGRYARDRVVASFVGAFPMSDPEVLVVITLDEPEDRSGPEPRRGAGITAAPVARAVIERVAPLLGVPARRAALDASSAN